MAITRSRSRCSSSESSSSSASSSASSSSSSSSASSSAKPSPAHAPQNSTTRHRRRRGSDTSELRIRSTTRVQRSPRHHRHHSHSDVKYRRRVNRSTVRRSRARPEKAADEASQSASGHEYNDRRGSQDPDLERLGRRARRTLFPDAQRDSADAGGGGRSLGKGLSRAMTLDRLTRTLRSERRDVGGSGSRRKIQERSRAGDDRDPVYVSYSSRRPRDPDDGRSGARRVETVKTRRSTRVVELPSRGSDSQTFTRSNSTREGGRKSRNAGLGRSRAATTGREPGGTLSSRTAVESPPIISVPMPPSRPLNSSSGPTGGRRGSTGGGFFSMFRSVPAGTTSRSETVVQCQVCLADDLIASKTARLACGHRMCYVCLKRQFELSTLDPSHMPPKCCTSSPIPYRHVEHLFNDRFKMIWNKKFQEATARDKIYCPARGCGEWIKPINMQLDRHTGLKFGTCRRCKTKVCAKCGDKWHGRRECAADEETTRFAEVAKREGWQRCYNCKAMVELEEGCNHMTCRCRAEFCMVCGAPWKTCNCLWFNNTAVDDDDRLEMNVARDRRVEVGPDTYRHRRPSAPLPPQAPLPPSANDRRPLTAQTRRFSSFLSRSRAEAGPPTSRPYTSGGVPRPVTADSDFINDARTAARRAQARHGSISYAHHSGPRAAPLPQRRRSPDDDSLSISRSSASSNDSALARRRSSYRRNPPPPQPTTTTTRRQSVIVDESGHVIARYDTTDIPLKRTTTGQGSGPLLRGGSRRESRDRDRDPGPPPAAFANVSRTLGGIVRSFSQNSGTAASRLYGSSGDRDRGRPPTTFQTTRGSRFPSQSQPPQRATHATITAAGAAAAAAATTRSRPEPVTWTSFTRNLRRASTGGYGRGRNSNNDYDYDRGQPVKASQMAGLGPEVGGGRRNGSGAGGGRVGAWLRYVVDDPVAVEGG